MKFLLKINEILLLFNKEKLKQNLFVKTIKSSKITI